ncbi:MAG: hypothetical protein ACXWV8_14725, partial [Chitinophagaceae bacterium]
SFGEVAVLYIFTDHHNDHLHFISLLATSGKFLFYQHLQKASTVAGSSPSERLSAALPSNFIYPLTILREHFIYQPFR